MKYRKKPVVIEAFLWNETVEMLETLKSSGAHSVSYNGHLDRPNECTHLRIKTLEGTMNVSPGDFIIKGVKGEFYPCKPDIFEATYESAELPRLNPLAYLERLWRGWLLLCGFLISCIQ